MWSKIFLLSALVVAIQTVPIHDEQAKTGRIVGGEESEINEFPYQVSIHYNYFHVCGGVIIDQTTILTTAHCIVGYVISINIINLIV